MDQHLVILLQKIDGINLIFQRIARLQMKDVLSDRRFISATQHHQDGLDGIRINCTPLETMSIDRMHHRALQVSHYGGVLTKQKELTKMVTIQVQI